MTIMNEPKLFPNSFMTEWNQSIDLQSKLMNWFLYDMDLHHKRVNVLIWCNLTNPYDATGLFLYPLKKSESHKFSGIFNG